MLASFGSVDIFAVLIIGAISLNNLVSIIEYAQAREQDQNSIER